MVSVGYFLQRGKLCVEALFPEMGKLDPVPIFADLIKAPPPLRFSKINAFRLFL
jgi:hypothetical protein